MAGNPRKSQAEAVPRRPTVWSCVPFKSAGSRQRNGNGRWWLAPARRGIPLRQRAVGEPGSLGGVRSLGETLEQAAGTLEEGSRPKASGFPGIAAGIRQRAGSSLLTSGTRHLVIWRGRPGDGERNGTCRAVLRHVPGYRVARENPARPPTPAARRKTNPDGRRPPQRVDRLPHRPPPRTRAGRKLDPGSQRQHTEPGPRRPAALDARVLERKLGWVEGVIGPRCRSDYLSCLDGRSGGSGRALAAGRHPVPGMPPSVRKRRLMEALELG